MRLTGTVAVADEVEPLAVPEARCPLLAGLVVDTAGYGWAFALTGGVILLGALAWWRAPETNLPIVPGGPRTGSLPLVRPEDARVTPREDG